MSKAVLTDEEIAELRAKPAAYVCTKCGCCGPSGPICPRCGYMTGDVYATEKRLLVTFTAVQERARIAWREHEKAVDALDQRTRERDEAQIVAINCESIAKHAVKRAEAAERERAAALAEASELRAEHVMTRLEQRVIAAERERDQARADERESVGDRNAAADKADRLERECAALIEMLRLYVDPMNVRPEHQAIIDAALAPRPTVKEECQHDWIGAMSTHSSPGPHPVHCSKCGMTVTQP